MPVKIRGKVAKEDQTVTVTQSFSVIFKIRVDDMTGGLAFDMYKVMRDQASFYTLASCFDQCKIRDAWVRIVVNTINPPEACANGRSPLVAVAWDRNGVKDNQSLDFAAVSNYSSAKVIQLGSLIVGKPIDTGISAASAQELLEYVSTDFIMSEGVPSGEWHPTLLVSTLFPQGQYQDPYIGG